jgi:cytoskeletal protein CcmA (bactofilin family)
MNVDKGKNDEFKGKFKSGIGPGISVVGNIKAKENFRVEGFIEGNVEVEGLLLIGNSGSVKGEVKASEVVIEGAVEGNITSDKRLELRLSGKIKGDIKAQRVAIADGAFFNGQLTTITG